MNTRWNSSERRQNGVAKMKRRRLFETALHRKQSLPYAFAAAVAVATCTGCGFTGGQLLYLFGVGRAGIAKAQFRLTEEPLLILLDDPTGRLDWPPAGAYFVDELAQRLIKNKAAKKIIPRQTLDGIRRTLPSFEKRGCREIGELTGAEQVLWVRVRQFLATELILDTSQAAYFSVAVKVINVKETQRSRVRLWPASPAGHFLTVSMNGSEVASERTKAAIARAIAGKLADHVAKLFYDYRLGDFENAK